MHKLKSETIGDGIPLILLHGGYLDRRQMKFEMEPVFKGRGNWKRVYIDLPNHGETGVVEGVSNYNDMLILVCAFLDYTFPNQKYALAGMSAGGHIARGIAAKRKAQVLGVMINAAPFEVDRDERKLPQASKIHEDPGFAKLAGDGTEMLRRLQPVRDAHLVDWYHECFVPAQKLFCAAEAKASWKPENYAFDFDLSSSGEKLSGPTLIMTGRQDGVAGYEDAWASLEQFPHATFVALDMVGHIIEPANRKLFRCLVSDWLDRIERECS